MGGIKFKDNKSISNHFVEKQIDPNFVYICLNANVGSAATAVVKKGDAVKIGTLIGKAGEGISANVYSSVSGTVSEITEFDNKPYVIIANNKKNEVEKLPKLKNYSRENLLKRLEESGIIGLGGAGFPTHFKYKTDKKIDTLILNGCECDDYLTCDSVLMQTHPLEVLKGGKYLADILGLNTFFVAVLDNKPEAIAALREAASKLEGATAIIIKLKTKYPMGAEKLLIKKVCKRVVPPGELPADEGVMVSNVASSFAFYNAVENNLPLTERMVTVSGHGVNEVGNCFVKNGTTILDILNAFGGEKFEAAEIAKYSNTIRELRDKERASLDKNEKTTLNKKIKAEAKKFNKLRENEVSKIIVGGAMMGFAARSVNIPLNLKDGGVLFFNAHEIETSEPQACINCKKCIRVCPVRIKPVSIAKALDANEFKLAKSFDPQACINCGCCNFVCPAKIDLKEKVNKAKRLK